MFKKHVEEGLEIVGSNGRYQYTIGLLLLIIGIFGDITYTGMPLMETAPIANVPHDGKIFHLKINYSICSQNFTINETITKSNWIHDYGIFCDKFLVSLIGFMMCFGGFTGSLLLQYLKEKGTKFTFVTICILLIFSSFLILYNNLILFYLFIFLNGLCGLVIFILKINIITDLVDKDYRSYYNNIIISGGNVSMILNYLLFNNDFNWKLIYLMNSILIFIFVLIFHKIYIENPRFYFVRNDKIKMIDSLLYIAKYNRKDKNLNLREKLNNYFNYNNLELNNSISCEDDDKESNLKSSYRYKISNENLSTNNNITEYNYLFYNFIISYPLTNFLYFIYMIEIKEYSYIIHSYIYWFCILSIIFSCTLSPIMNLLGRKKLKILLIIIFGFIFILSKLLTLRKSVRVLFYLSNRLILHSISMVNHTHINESFPSTIRLKVFGLVFTLSKLILLIAPFTYEYLNPYNFIITISILVISLISFCFQKETSNKVLEDL